MTATLSKKKILILTDGNFDHPSSRIRILQFIPQLESINFRISWIPRISREPSSFLGRLNFAILKRYYFLKTRLFVRFGNWDLVFVQRERIEIRFLKHLESKNIPLIFDFDDSIFLTENKLKSESMSTALMVKYANAVIISTPYLAKFCKIIGKESHLIPTSVDGELIKPKTQSRAEKVPVIGWIGSQSTTVVLKQVEDALRRLARELKYRLILIGADTSYQPEGIPFEHLPWQLNKEPEYIGMMDIGIMPLLPIEYSKGKGGYKLYVYMAAGIPVVATPIGINSDIVKEGINGYLAANPEEWQSKLTTLLQNPNLRHKMGEIGREQFEKEYSTKVAFAALSEIISGLVK